MGNIKWYWPRAKKEVFSEIVEKRIAIEKMESFIEEYNSLLQCAIKNKESNDFISRSKDKIISMSACEAYFPPIGSDYRGTMPHIEIHLIGGYSSHMIDILQNWKMLLFKKHSTLPVTIVNAYTESLRKDLRKLENTYYPYGFVKNIKSLFSRFLKYLFSNALSSFLTVLGTIAFTSLIVYIFN